MERKLEKLNKLQKQDDLLRQEFYREATEKDNSCFITTTQYEELRKNTMRFNITPGKDWPPLNTMYKEHYKDLFKKGIFRDIIMLDAMYENGDITMEIKFIVNPPSKRIVRARGDRIFTLSI